ncbi:MAG: phosphoribosylanthranilate isomerase [Ruminococcus sp.]|nr:phosphoribosylanthranilate isomerase [Ruminococcus sp.]
MTKIKLCGMMTVADVAAASRLEADYIGFILTERFRRSVSFAELCELKATIRSPRSRAVGVFVDEEIDSLLRFSELIDVIQLHGQEDEGYIRALRRFTDKPIIKAFKVETAEDTATAAKSSADLVLLDSGTGTGHTFDWSLIRNVGRPYLLAGGLDADNVRGAIELLQPYAVDASSGLETDGHKDVTKMEAFVRAVRAGRPEVRG